MGNWVELSVRADRKEDLDRNDMLNMDIEPESVFGTLTVDLDKVSGYGPLLGEEGEPHPNFSELMMDSGFWMIIELPYSELKKLFAKSKKTKE